MTFWDISPSIDILDKEGISSICKYEITSQRLNYYPSISFESKKNVLGLGILKFKSFIYFPIIL